ncbi:MAG TPA: acyl-CoA thioesterase [Geopsychrobacteraceae bacterium]|jgi:acyl-CoA hydrolase
MENFTLVRPEHLNHHGYLFGGMMLKWVDETAWMAASREFPGCTLVTIGMDDIRFTQRVDNGAILRFSVVRQTQGRSSVSYAVSVSADAPGAAAECEVFKTRVTFVRVDAQGKSCPLPKAER